VFLDEICNISDAMQVKLLRVVQEQQVVRVGSVRPISIDVRFIAATNRNLEAMVEAGHFRHDLYHRLNVVKIRMPPLRDRREDIPVLTQAFVEEFAQRYHRQAEGFDAQSLERLQGYGWPGNVRELRNLVERHIALADSPVLHLDPRWPDDGAPDAGTASLDADKPDLATLERALYPQDAGAHGRQSGTHGPGPGYQQVHPVAQAAAVRARPGLVRGLTLHPAILRGCRMQRFRTLTPARHTQVPDFKACTVLARRLLHYS
jgi:DNA-binding NtrC family response regulator